MNHWTHQVANNIITVAAGTSANTARHIIVLVSRNTGETSRWKATSWRGTWQRPWMVCI